MLSKHSQWLILVCCLVCLNSGCVRTIAPVTTFWQKLGIPQAIGGVADNTLNRRGNNPELERKPPLKRIADPANLEAENPAIKAAAEIKTEEDLAKQKIKALKYLVEIGCSGCYDKDGKVEGAILSGLNDCTKSVRLAAIDTISELASNCDSDAAYGSQPEEKGIFGRTKRCMAWLTTSREESACRSTGCNKCCGNCCTFEIQKRLTAMVHEEKNGCWLEPSAEVREAALEALKICPCPVVDCPKADSKSESLPKPAADESDPEAQSEEDDEEGDEDEQDDEKGSDKDQKESVASLTDSILRSANQGFSQAGNRNVAVVSQRSNSQQMASAVSNRYTTKQVRHATTLPSNIIKRVAETASAVTKRQQVQSNSSELIGLVEFVDVASKSALVVFQNASNIPKGTRVICQLSSNSGNKISRIQCTIVETSSGLAGLRPVNPSALAQLTPGMRVAITLNVKGSKSSESVADSKPTVKLISQETNILQQEAKERLDSQPTRLPAVAPSNPFRQ